MSNKLNIEYKDLIIAYLEGKEIQFKFDEGDYRDCTPNCYPDFTIKYDPTYYRVKPEIVEYFDYYTIYPINTSLDDAYGMGKNLKVKYVNDEIAELTFLPTNQTLVINNG